MSGNVITPDQAIWAGDEGDDEVNETPEFFSEGNAKPEDFPHYHPPDLSFVTRAQIIRSFKRGQRKPDEITLPSYISVVEGITMSVHNQNEMLAQLAASLERSIRTIKDKSDSGHGTTTTDQVDEEAINTDQISSQAVYDNLPDSITVLLNLYHECYQVLESLIQKLNVTQIVSKSDRSTLTTHLPEKLNSLLHASEKILERILDLRSDMQVTRAVMKFGVEADKLHGSCREIINLMR